MNYTDYADYYRAELDYRREQIGRDLAPGRRWRRARAAAATARREDPSKIASH